MVEADTPNGTVLSVVTVSDEDGEGEDEAAFELGMETEEDAAELFRLERIRNGMALIRLNGSLEGKEQRSGRGWILRIGAKGPNGTEKGPREMVQVNAL